MKVLLERHLVYQLVDFYLGDDSPQARAHGQQRKKMGDKFSSPNLVFMADTLSLLVRGCYTRVSLLAPATPGSAPVPVPPTAIAEVPLQFMPNEDLAILYYPTLYIKALREGINPKAITDIILHLCWEDEG